MPMAENASNTYIGELKQIRNQTDGLYCVRFAVCVPARKNTRAM